MSTTGHTARSYWPYFLVTGSLSMAYGSVFTLLHDFREKLGFSETELGVIVAVGFFAGFIAQVGLARFADRGHVRLLVHAGVIVAFVSMFSMAMTDEAWQFTVARFCLGAGTGATGPAIRRILITRDPANMGANLGKMGAFDIVGFVLGPVMAGVLAEFVNLRAPFVFMACLYVLLYGWIFRLDLSAGEGTTVKVPVRRLFRSRSFNAGMLGGLAFFITIGVFEVSWSLLLGDLGASTLVIALSIALFALPMIPLAPFGGRLAQREGPMRIMPYSILGAVACMLVYGYVELVWVIIAVSALHAMFDAFTMPAGQLAVALSSSSQQAAAAQGLYAAMGLFVAGIASLVGGFAYENWGPEILYAGSSALMVVAVGAAVALGGDLRGPADRSHPEPASAPS